MIKRVYVEITSSEIAKYISQDMSEDDLRVLIECFGIKENYDEFVDLIEQTEWDALYPSGVKFLKLLRDKLNKIKLD